MEGHSRGLEIIITMTAPIFIVAKRLPTAAPKCFVINRKSCSPLKNKQHFSVRSESW